MGENEELKDKMPSISSCIDSGVTKDFIRKQLEKASEEEPEEVKLSCPGEVTEEMIENLSLHLDEFITKNRGTDYGPRDLEEARDYARLAGIDTNQRGTLISSAYLMLEDVRTIEPPELRRVSSMLVKSLIEVLKMDQKRTSSKQYEALESINHTVGNCKTENGETRYLHNGEWRKI